MDVKAINEHLLRGDTTAPGLFPHLDELEGARYRFDVTFGLERLPEAEGVLLIRGPRQYGKSTWLEAQLRETIEQHGPGSALYLNGDELRDADALLGSLAELAAAFPRRAPIRRLFIDEITAFPEIERLNIGPVSTMAISWDQPHEGNMFEFLWRRRSIERAW